MHWGLVRTIILLPGTVVVFIPGVIVLFTNSTRGSVEWPDSHQVEFWVALLVGSMGVGLCVWTVTLFMKIGDGTPAPWDPPQKLVIRGPYHHVRNPMITGVLLVLLAEALFLRSWPIALWMILFFAGNSVYFPLFEEKGLVKRFGNDYQEYKSHVPRWIPRVRAWKQGSDGR